MLRWVVLLTALLSPVVQGQVGPSYETKLVFLADEIPVGEPTPFRLVLTSLCNAAVMVVPESEFTVDWEFAEDITVDGPETITFPAQTCATDLTMEETEEYEILLPASTPGLKRIPGVVTYTRLDNADAVWGVPPDHEFSVQAAADLVVVPEVQNETQTVSPASEDAPAPGVALLVAMITGAAFWSAHRRT